MSLDFRQNFRVSLDEPPQKPRRRPRFCQMWALLLLLLSVSAASPAPLPFTAFTQSCERSIPGPLTRFWGSRPHPDLSMIAPGVLWQPDDPNLAVLPLWNGTGGDGLTAPFVDTHIAVRFLGGVGNFSDVTAPNCTDRVKGLRGPGGVDRLGTQSSSHPCPGMPLTHCAPCFQGSGAISW